MKDKSKKSKKKKILMFEYKLNIAVPALIVKRHYDSDSRLTDRILLLPKCSLKISPSLEISRLSYRLYCLHTFIPEISTLYDAIKIETRLCFSSVVRRVSTNFSDNPRIHTHASRPFPFHVINLAPNGRRRIRLLNYIKPDLSWMIYFIVLYDCFHT